MEKKWLDFIASLCLVFDVDWSSDFADDAYCLDREPAAAPAKRPAVELPQPGFAAAAVSRAV